MTRVLIVLIGLLWGGGVAAQGSLSFKGLAIGASEDEVVKRYPRARCSGPAEKRFCMLTPSTFVASKLRGACPSGEAFPECSRRASAEAGYETVAGVDAEYVAFHFLKGKLSAISISTPSSKSSTIETAFLDAYGPPSDDRVSPFRTKGGQTYENRHLRWHLNDGAIVLYRMLSRADRSLIEYLSAEEVAARAAEAEEDRKKASKDL